MVVSGDGNKLFLFRRVIFTFLTTVVTPPSSSWWSHLTQSSSLADSSASNFQGLVSGGLYVDKTMFIKEFVEKSGKLSLIVRPKGWGKTTNLDTLKTFLESQVDDRGRPLNASTNRLLFTGTNERGKKPLRISKAEDTMKQHQGQYPVLWLTFENITGVTYDEIKDKLRITIGHLFFERAYLKSNVSDSEEEMTFNAYSKGRMKDEADFGRSLRLLSELLGRYFGRRVYVLIDDYDRPINHLFRHLVQQQRNPTATGRVPEWIAYLEASKMAEFNRTVSFLESVLCACLIDNPVLEKALLSGIFAVKIAETFERLENVDEYTCVDEQFSEFYGFTEEEVEGLLTSRGLRSTVNLDKLRNWYGYNFANDDTNANTNTTTDTNTTTTTTTTTTNTTTSTTTAKVLYNPTSIRRFIEKSGVYGDYRDEDSEAPLVGDMLEDDEMQLKSQNFVDGGSIEGMLPRRIGYDRIWDELSVMMYSGYLSVKFRVAHVWSVVAANREITNAMRRKISQWVCDRFNVTDQTFRSLADLLSCCEVDAFERDLRNVTAAVPSSDRRTLGQLRLYYNGLLQTLTYWLLRRDYVIVERFRPSRDFETPCLFLVREEEGARGGTNAAGYRPYSEGIVIGGKILDHSENLQGNAIEGLKQICAYNVNSKGFPTIKRVLKISLAFCGQHVVSDHTIFQYG